MPVPQGNHSGSEIQPQEGACKKLAEEKQEAGGVGMRLENEAQMKMNQQS